MKKLKNSHLPRLTLSYFFKIKPLIISFLLITLISSLYAQDFDELIFKLHNGSYSEKSQAARDLGQSRDKRAVEPLIQALNSNPISGLNDSYLIALGFIGDERAVEPIISYLSNDIITDRLSAIQALGMLGDERAIVPLSVYLHNKDVGIRYHSAEALGNIGSVQAVKPLVRALNDRDYYVRKYVVAALSKIGGKQVIDPLIKALSDENSSVRNQAVLALRKIGFPSAKEPLFELLKDKEAKVRENTVITLETLNWEPENEYQSIIKYYALNQFQECTNMGDTAVVPLISILYNGPENLRPFAAEILGNIGDNRAVEQLIYALKYRDIDTKISSAIALGKIGDSSAVKPLIHALKFRDDATKKESAIALGKIGDERAIKPLIVALNDKDEYVREYAAKALNKLNWEPESDYQNAVNLIAARQWRACIDMGSEAVNPLIEALKNKDIRLDVISTLGEIGDSRAVEPLIDILKKQYSFDDLLKAKNDDLLKAKDFDKIDFKFDFKSTGQPIIPDLSIMPGASWYFGKPKRQESKYKYRSSIGYYSNGDTKNVEQMKTAPNDRISKTQEDDDKWQIEYSRASAAKALGKIGDSRAVGPLVSALGDEYSGVRKEAATALIKFGWKPKSVADSIHLYVAERNVYQLEQMWGDTRIVLLEDIIYGNKNRIKIAVLTFIGLGKEEIIPDLIETLNTDGSVAIAEAYLNCGNSELISAAESWARNHGYIITSGSGNSLGKWGQW